MAQLTRLAQLKRLTHVARLTHATKGRLSDLTLYAALVLLPVGPIGLASAGWSAMSAGWSAAGVNASAATTAGTTITGAVAASTASTAVTATAALPAQLPQALTPSLLLFACYVALNGRSLPCVARRHLPWFAVPFVALIVSLFGWLTMAFHPLTAAATLLALLFGACVVAALDIALRVRRIPARRLVTMVVAGYGLAGVVAAVAGALSVAAPAASSTPAVAAPFAGPLSAVASVLFGGVGDDGTGVPYAFGDVRLVFADPAVPVMHLFGVLVPLLCLTRDRRLAVLTPALALGAGALQVATVGVRASVAAAIAYARAASFPAVAPLLAAAHDPWHGLLGFGAGNVGDALRAGYPYAADWVTDRGGRITARMRAVAEASTQSASVTSAFTSWVTEFGLLALAALFALTLWWITRNHAWRIGTVCWLIMLVLLYAQYEAYAFYAFPLFVWFIGANSSSHDCDNSTTKTDS